MTLDINRKWASNSLERTHFDGKHAYDSTDLSVVLTAMDNVVTETMSRGVSHKAVALLANVVVSRVFNEWVSMWHLSALKLNEGNNGCIQTQKTIVGRKSLQFVTGWWCCFAEWPERSSCLWHRLGSLRIVKYAGKITHHPKWKTSSLNLVIIGKLYWLAKERADSCNRSICRYCMPFKSLWGCTDCQWATEYLATTFNII